MAHPLDTSYDVNHMRDRVPFGDAWVFDRASFEHGQHHAVAMYKAENTDGHDVTVFCEALPARFYVIKAYANATRSEWTMKTGSGQAELAHTIARAIAVGDLARGV